MINFQKKIFFLYEVVYNESINELTKAFIPNNHPTSKEIRSRKVTTKKWLSESVKSVNKFHNDYYSYPISKLSFENGEEVFPLTAFTEWSIDEFEMRYYDYLNEKNREDTDINYKISLLDYRYMYYYHEENKSLAYFKIDYTDDDKVQFETTHHAQLITYNGKIKRHLKSSTLHYIVENDFEMMFCSFSKLDLKLNKFAYGIILSKDFHLRNPKSSYVVLSQEKFSKEEEEFFLTKINPTNIIIVNNEKQLKDESFIQNLSTHICNLTNFSSDYNSDNIFLKLFLEEIKLFNKKFYNFQNKYEFKFTSFSSSMKTMLKLLNQSKNSHNIKVLYTLENIEESLFSPIDDFAKSLYNFIIENSKKKKISFEFIIAIKSKVIINKDLEEKLKKFEEAGILLRFRSYKEIFSYSTIILIDDYQLAISCIKGDKEYIATRASSDIGKLKKEYNKQKSYSKFLSTILEKNYALNGTYYMYCYGSNNNLYTVKLMINGNDIDGEIISPYHTKYQGEVQRIYGDILLCTEYGIIKFKEENERDIIKIVSLIGDQVNGNKQPILIFAILSRIELEEQDREKIFSAMVDERYSPYEKGSFKLSLSLYDVMKPLLYNYEEIERKDLLIMKEDKNN